MVTPVIYYFVTDYPIIIIIICSFISDALGTCLVDLEWSSEKNLERKLTAFKLKLVDEKMPQLMKTILDIISNDTNVSQMVKLVKTAFREFGMALKTIKLGSLMFVFQHTDEEKGADWLLGSEEARGRLIGILNQFLPNWVRVHASWDTFQYVLTDSDRAWACDMSPLSTWWMPLPTSPYYGGKSIMLFSRGGGGVPLRSLNNKNLENSSLLGFKSLMALKKFKIDKAKVCVCVSVSLCAYIPHR